jgi:penicillin-insensitive murein endopeptidase
MLLPDSSGVDPARFGPRQVSLLKLAASDPRVERIFVHPVIKLALCRADGGAWLQRIRPWWGHDDHFHVRLACPADSPLCVAQKPVPDGVGCDTALEDWAHHQAPPKAAGPPVKQPIPAACVAVLRER